jgi:hypothetical protein
VLEELVKNAGGIALGGGIVNMASTVLKKVAGGSKFSKSDIKKVYFVNTSIFFYRITDDYLS